MRGLVSRLTWILLLTLLLQNGAAATGTSGPATLTVHVGAGTTKTTLHLQPGFATVVRADHRVDTVAVGDPRLLTASTVKRGQDVYDIVLQPQMATGITNMIIWFGEITSIWDLTIGPGLRTADIVYVVTVPPAVKSPPPPPQAGPPQAQGSEAGATTPASSPDSAARPGGSKGAAVSTREEAANAPPLPDQYLEVQQALNEATGLFRVFRERHGIKIRYRITNQSATDFEVRPNGILVRVNGRLVPFGMSRDNVDKSRPGVLPSGATEAGTVNVPAKAPRQVVVIFSLFPAADDRRASTQTLPATFQCMFTGLERLVPAARR